MNTKFIKALYQLDKGKYSEAEENIKQAISETDNLYELLEIYACYAELLNELKRYDEAMECVNFILNNNEDYKDSVATKTALEIKCHISTIL
ncbi:MAG: hypothetical protein ACI4GV_09575 [Acutalibacteraceae bacterium]